MVKMVKNDMKLIRSVFKMIQDIGSKNRAISIWGKALNLPQLFGGLVFIMTIEGHVVLSTLILTLVIAGQIHKGNPFSRLIGTCHLPWLVMAPWLLYRLQTIEHELSFQIWGYYVLTTIIISLVFDLLDTCRYFNGEKTHAWAK